MTDAQTMAVTRPILPSADLDATDAFYRTLGFDQSGRWPEYMIMAGPDEIELHFWHKPEADRWTNDVACWIGYPSVPAVYRRYEDWSAVPLTPPAQLNSPDDRGGHLVEFQLIDIHGNLLRLGAVKSRAT